MSSSTGEGASLFEFLGEAATNPGSRLPGTAQRRIRHASKQETLNTRATREPGFQYAYVIPMVTAMMGVACSRGTWPANLHVRIPCSATYAIDGGPRHVIIATLTVSFTTRHEIIA